MNCILASIVMMWFPALWYHWRAMIYISFWYSDKTSDSGKNKGSLTPHLCDMIVVVVVLVVILPQPTQTEEIILYYFNGKLFQSCQRIPQIPASNCNKRSIRWECISHKWSTDVLYLSYSAVVLCNTCTSFANTFIVVPAPTSDKHLGSQSYISLCLIVQYCTTHAVNTF